MKRKWLATAFAVIASVFFSTFANVTPARSGVVTIEFAGIGTGSLGSNFFEGSPFLFFLQGPDGGGSNGILLTTASVTIFSFPLIPTATFSPPSSPTYANLDNATLMAFLTTNPLNGGGSSPSDLAQITFSPADFAILTTTNLFINSGPLVFSFNTIQTSGGLLMFEDTSPLLFTAFSTGAVPELSTWAMMLLGFGGVGFFAYRRAKKTALTAV